MRVAEGVNDLAAPARSRNDGERVGQRWPAAHPGLAPLVPEVGYKDARLGQHRFNPLPVGRRGRARELDSPTDTEARLERRQNESVLLEHDRATEHHAGCSYGCIVTPLSVERNLIAKAGCQPL